MRGSRAREAGWESARFCSPCFEIPCLCFAVRHDGRQLSDANFDLLHSIYL